MIKILFMNFYKNNIDKNILKAYTVLRYIIQLTLQNKKGGNYLLNINYRDSRPIYEQIMDGIKELLMSGAIKKDEKLPSVRELASVHAINPNTIQRAYKDLETAGYIYSVPGKGSFAVDVSEISERHFKDLYSRLDVVLHDFDAAGADRKEIADYILKKE